MAALSPGSNNVSEISLVTSLPLSSHTHSAASVVLSNRAAAREEEWRFV